LPELPEFEGLHGDLLVTDEASLHGFQIAAKLVGEALPSIHLESRI